MFNILFILIGIWCLYAGTYQIHKGSTSSHAAESVVFGIFSLLIGVKGVI